ncbi:MAG TPA: enolase C-terminal domain-like protein [Isosphaeraceae bacterium]|jgi:glucarate dehydratase|nr:enolase C-terminal domain-like protein [Isosphaeraceae bacterium]
MMHHRREWFGLSAAGLLGAHLVTSAQAGEAPGRTAPLRIKDLKVTPIALPDPPLLASSGCHGPYFLRNVVELETDGGIVGIGETVGGERMTAALHQARDVVKGQNAFAYRAFSTELKALAQGAFAGIELACLDACGQATGRRACELLGGPVRERVEFAAYLFYRYAADHPTILADPHVVDGRGKGAKALDSWGEVRTPEAMAAMADKFRATWGFRVFKLKGGVLPPDVELESMRAMNAKFGGKCPLRIDPNGRWRVETAKRIGQQLHEVALEYYEDPVDGQAAMAEVRQATGLPMSTNMCVTRLDHIPEALRLHPIDVLLLDNHYWGGISTCQAVGTVCEFAHWKASQHSNSHAGITMAAMITLAAVVPQVTLASDTHYPWLVESADILEGPKLPIQDGHMTVPAGPGLGVRLDQDKLARAHEVYQKCGMRGRDDASLMKQMEPGWTGAKY